MFCDNLWTNTCEIGGKLFAHIPAKEALYYFDSPFDSQGSFFTLTKKIWKFFSILKHQRLDQILQGFFINNFL